MLLNLRIQSNITSYKIMENKFEQHVEKVMKSMDQRLEDLEGKITSIDTKLSQVVDAILGNPLTNDGGVVNGHRCPVG
jgi:hydrogenase maturation factor